MRWSGDRGAVITIVPSNRPRCCRTAQATCSVNQPVTATDTAMIAALELPHLRLQPGALRAGVGLDDPVTISMNDSIHTATRGTWSYRSALHPSRLPAHPQPHHRHVTLAFFGQGEVASDASTQLIPRPLPTPILAGYRFPPRHVPRSTCSGTDTRFEPEEQKGDGQGPASISTGQGPGH